MVSRIHTVAVYPPGAFRIRVLIDDIDDADTTSQEVLQAAKRWVRQAIDALSHLPADQWCTRVVSSTEVEDVSPKTQPEKAPQ